MKNTICFNALHYGSIFYYFQLSVSHRNVSCLCTMQTENSNCQQEVIKYCVNTLCLHAISFQLYCEPNSTE